jgi:hypothetical protein
MVSKPAAGSLRLRHDFLPLRERRPLWVGKPGRSVTGFPAVLSVGRSTVTNVVDRDDFLVRVDLTHDPVVAYANSVQSVGPGQFHGLTREGIFAKTPGSV